MLSFDNISVYKLLHNHLGYSKEGKKTRQINKRQRDSGNAGLKKAISRAYLTFIMTPINRRIKHYRVSSFGICGNVAVPDIAMDKNRLDVPSFGMEWPQESWDDLL